MLKQSIIGVTAASLVMLGILLSTTTPSNTGPLGILGFFVFMYLAALGVLTFLLRFIGLIISRAIPGERTRFSISDISVRRSYYYASVLALVPVMLIAMQSVGHVGVYQILLMGFFVMIAWIYVTNRTS